MGHRYYVLPAGEKDSLANGPLDLDGPEAHHLLHVMRCTEGDVVTLFDGRGGEYTAQITRCDRRRVTLAVGPHQQISRERTTRIVAGVALPKGDRQKWLVEKLTELGVAQLVPLVTERSVVDLRDKSRDKLERVVIEACKQCGRNQLMEITLPQPLTQFVTTSHGTRLIAHPDGQPLQELENGLGPQNSPVTLAIGPEGGFSDEEVDLAEQAGWQRVNLGPTILRIETAALALAVAVAR